MSSRNEVTLPATRPKSRKSLAYMPSTNTVDKENMTADIGALGGAGKKTILGERPPKKSRSKSIGPGGLDALKDATGNRRQSIAAPPPRSILKPTIPQLQEIPARKATLIETKEVSNLNPAENPPSTAPPSSSIEVNPAVVETRVMLRTEEEQQAAVREREEKETGDQLKDLNARREARRKSLANRRVSFAPEATLHTWDVVEYLQDSTTSSASTNSSRRASSMSAESVASPRPQAPGLSGSDPSEPPSTPPEQIEDTVAASPAHQRDLHQKKRRRSSGIPPLNFNNPDDEVYSSSPFSDGSAAADDNQNPGFVVDDGNDNSDSNSDDEEGTAMSLDMGDLSDMSLASVKSAGSSTGSSARLEEALQLAARQAGTQGIDFDEHGNTDAAEEEAVASFKPWSKKSGVQILSPSHDQENVNPFIPESEIGLQTHIVGQEEDGMTMEMTRAVGRIMPTEQPDDEMTMDMTVAIGRIMPAVPEGSAVSRRKSVAPGRRQSTRRRSSTESTALGDETMDLTMAIGGIQQGQENNNTRNDVMGDEDMSMELTSVIGGVLAPATNAASKSRRRSSVARRESAQGKRRRSMMPTIEDQTMDMTMAVGSILSVKSDKNTIEDSTHNDMDMDLTMALGEILPQQPSATRASNIKHMIARGAESAKDASSPASALAVEASQQKTQAVTVASETGSPSLAAFRGKGLRRSGVSRNSTTPKSAPKIAISETPVKSSNTPSKELTQQRIQSTPTRATSANILNSSDEVLTSTASVLRKPSTPNKLFQKDHVTGAPVPSIVLTPQRRRSSGIGIDRSGLGSPHVAALLDRRRSIGVQAIAFTSGSLSDISRGVRFDDPHVIEEQLDRERQEEKDREDGRKIMEREADTAEVENDVTLNLKEMIESLTPKKRPLKGRKSLHVGAAKGILGKRPAELDEDEQENDEDEGGVKRLKNHQGSPVKNVKLKAPPSKAETTGRLTRAARRSLEYGAGNITTPTTKSSPAKGAITPKSQGRFKEVEPRLTDQPVIPFIEKFPVDDPIMDEGEFGNEQMHLQDFLNMTSIRFMELTTTKRRHTVAPKQDGPTSAVRDADGSLESCVAAAACTVPMLELFQHSCRELKKYISEGRSIVREIEMETFEENPPLFREYLSATPDVRVLMDNQFKNVKTHARLLSKAMWYEWRMKLLDGLKDGLHKISEGMQADAEILHHQQELLDTILPALIEQHDRMAEEQADLQSAADELANCDQEELGEARQKLTSVEADVECKKRMIQDLREQLREKEAHISTAADRKQSCLNSIEEAEKVRELCRGWTADEGLALKAKVDDLESQHGWAITGVSGTQVSMTYRRDIELVFDASSFKRHSPRATSKRPINSRIDLWYVAGNRELHPVQLTSEKDFFLQNIREYCRCLPQAETTVNDLLVAVSASWTKALETVSEIQSLNRNCPTEVSRTSDSSILVRSALLLSPLKTKVDIQMNVHAQCSQSGVDIELTPQCIVIYGERFNEAKMAEFLVNRTSFSDGERKSWGDIITELEGKLLARGRK